MLFRSPIIYHNLLINFDKRVSAEEAKMQLFNYKVPKSATLAQAESHIMLLASRAASKLPEGPTRTACYNHEACNALIRALPKQSSATVDIAHTKLSARLGRIATFAELSLNLNIFRDTIDEDIEENGVNDGFKNKNKGFVSRGYRALIKPRFSSIN